jgi:HSP20 family protein
MAVRGQWDPMKEMLQVQKRLNDLFETALARTDFGTEEGVGAWTPLADVYESREALHLDLELPGLEQEQIAVRLDGDELVVEGQREMDREQEGEQFHRVERSYGKFSRRFRLPSTVDRNAVDAVYRCGLLRVKVPRKRKGQAETVRVSVR